MVNYYIPSDEEMRLIKQKYKKVFVIVDIYKDMACTQLIKTINGKLISDSLNVESESIQRRTYTCNMVVDNSFTLDTTTGIRTQINDFDINPRSFVWMKRYLKVYYGIESNRPISAENYREKSDRVKINNNIFYWLVGTFTFVSPNYKYSAADRTLSISCIDYMCEYDGTKNGQLDYDQLRKINADGNVVIGALDTEESQRLNSSYRFKICRVAEYSNEKNSDGTRKVKSYMKMKDAILATLYMAGIATYEQYSKSDYSPTSGNYSLSGYESEDDKYLSSSLEFEPGQTFADVWNKLNEIYPNYEFFFDVSGKFIWREIPTCYDNNVVLSNKTIDELLISEERKDSFSNIYNCTEVWGKNFTLSLNDRYVSTSSYSNGTYEISLNLVDPITTPSTALKKSDMDWWFDNLDKIAFKVKTTNNADITKLCITGFDPSNNASYKFNALPIVDSSGNNIKANTLLANKVWIVVYHNSAYKVWDNSTKQYKTWEHGVFVLSGSTQAYGYYEENNEDCPYSVKSLGYRIPNRVVIDTAYTDDICYNYAERMTYESCAMKDTITLNMLIIPWLDVNQKIAYVSQFTKTRDEDLKKPNKDQPQYVVKNISWSTLDGTMTITAYRFREDFQWVWERRHKQ